MKKSFLSGIFIFFACVFFMNANSNQRIENSDGTITFTTIDEDKNAVEFKKNYDGFENVTIIYGEKVTKRNPLNIDLSDFGNRTLIMDFSCDIKILDKSGAEKNRITWMINDFANNFPVLCDADVKTGEWTTIKGSLTVPLTEKRTLYVSGGEFDMKNLTFYLKNFNLHLSGEGFGDDKPQQSWLEAESLKNAYKGIFDYFGLAVTENEFTNSSTRKGIVRHADCITMGNEFKPDFVFNWQKPTSFVDFVAEDGKTYKMPKNLPVFDKVDKLLKLCRDNNLTMRGHVLVWHSQTPKMFFTQNYKTGKKAVLVDKAEMTAREEWYIKTMLEHVSEWEQKNNDGKHIITVWDVVNEAVADNASSSQYLRQDSDWFRIFGDDTFIVNAFRFANKYAPKDVLLCYNDYGTNRGQSPKVSGVLKVVESIQASPDARIDVIGMQSHIGIDNPIKGYGSFEESIKLFLETGCDVQITELDVANGKQAYSPIILQSVYKDLYRLFIEYRKLPQKNGISGVTIWGLNDETTWLNSQKEHRGYKQFPLIFEGTGELKCKKAFYGVLEAGKEFSK